MTRRLTSLLILTLFLSACVTADPAAVARSVDATLTAVLTPTPIVVVVTALGGGQPIPTVTPDLGAQQTEAAATQTLAAGSATPLPPQATATAVPPSPTLPAATSTAAPASPVATNTGTATPPPPTASVAPLAHGDVIFQDDFTDASLWTLADDSVYRTTIADGQLNFTLKVGDRYRLIYNSRRRASDFVAALTASAPSCEARDRYGLLFRIKDVNNYYQFDVDCNAQYRLAKMVNNTLTPLKDWTKGAAVHSGPAAQNQLAVRANGKTLEIFVNGVSLATVSDETFSDGAFGLYAGSGISETYTAVFEQLDVWKVK